jgi:translation initiation factor IF-2
MMQTIKLHEATKQFGISNKLAMFFLKKKNIPVKSHSSVISIDQLESLREFSSNQDNFTDIMNEFNKSEKEKKQRAKKAKAEKLAPKTTEETAPEKESETILKEPPKKQPEININNEPKHEPKHEVKHEVKPEQRPQQKTAHTPTAPPVQEHIIKPRNHAPGPRTPRDLKAPAEHPRTEARKPQQPQHPHKIQQQKQQKPPQAHAPKHERTPERKHENKPERKQDQKFEPQRKHEQKPDRKPEQKRGLRTDKPVQPPLDDKTRKPKFDDRKKKFEPADKDRNDKIKRDKKMRPEKPKEWKKDNNAPQQPKTPPAHEPRPTPIPAAAERFQPKPGHHKHGQRPQKHFGRHDRRGRYDNKSQPQAQRQPQPPKPKPKPKVYNLPELIQTSNFINIKELAEKLNLKLKDIEERMSSSNKEYVTNQMLEVEDIQEICSEFKVEVDIVSYEDDVFFNHIEKLKSEKTSRAAVVTVMGHVDHGKTTLLDTLRDSRVAAREAGGITQKIGAYRLTREGTDIVFIDTPGHEAFTNIRARGAKVTDIVVLVVAANDGVKPQTIEAINHARAAEVPLVVAINKIDLPGADSNKVKQELTQHDVVVEDWGGDVVSVEISAKNNQNLEALLEMLTLVSEMLELKAYQTIPARGTIIESRLDPKLGPLGTVLIQHGKLNIGDFFICGNAIGKVKSIFNDQGKVQQNAEVPMPVEIMGFDEVPEAGELFQVLDDLEKAKKVVDIRKQIGKEAKKEDSFIDKRISLQNLFDKLEEEKTKVFPIIIKADNFSSCEVLEKLLQKYNLDQLKISIVHKGIGNITEGDILLASTSQSMVVGFNVKAPQKLMALAKREQVDIKLYNVIYHLIEDVDKAIKGEIEPEYIEKFIGTVEVLQLFKISKIGIIAGCLVKEGKVTKKSKIKVLRKNDLVFEGDLETLRRVKNDVSEVNAGTECGIRIKNFNAIEVGDILEIYETQIKT